MLYILESPELKDIGWNRCKVGISETPHSLHRRLCNHRTGSPVALDVVWLCPNAGYEEEQEVLRAFVDFRRPGTEYVLASAAELIWYVEDIMCLDGVGWDELEAYNLKTRKIGL